MQNHSPKTSRKSERGVALFIAIFALLLISVVALALMVMAGHGNVSQLQLQVFGAGLL